MSDVMQFAVSVHYTADTLVYVDAATKQGAIEAAEQMDHEDLNLDSAHFTTLKATRATALKSVGQAND